MHHDAFMAYCAAKVAVGEPQLAAVVRTLVARAEPELYEHVSGYGDDLFRTPLLFAAFASPERSHPLPQLMLGFVPLEERPAAIDVTTDEHGRLVLPAIGSFSTTTPHTELTLHLDGEPAHYALRDGERRVAANFEPSRVVPGTEAEILRHQHALLAPLFFENMVRACPVHDLGDAAVQHADALCEAFALLAAVEPAMFELVARTTRLLVTFHETRVPSFATVAAHGAAFFSARPSSGTAFFLDDLVHQCCHVLFNTMTARRSDVLRIAPDTRLGSLSGEPRDTRSVYGALHGLFGEYHMCRVLSRVLERELLPAAQAHELRGRLAFIAGKFARDSVHLDHDIYTDEGRVLVETLRRYASEFAETHRGLWDLDLTGQPYVFDCDLYRRKNPR